MTDDPDNRGDAGHGEPGAGGDCEGCARSRDYLAPEEEAVLRRMRALHAESVPLRQELASLPPGPRSAARRAEIKTQLEQLRARFARHRLELAAANRLKLRRLGYPP